MKRRRGTTTVQVTPREAQAPHREKPQEGGQNNWHGCPGARSKALSSQTLRADPDDPDARRWLPLRLAGASVPITAPALVVTELHPFGGVRQSSCSFSSSCAGSSSCHKRPAWMGSSARPVPLRTFWDREKCEKKTLETPHPRHQPCPGERS